MRQTPTLDIQPERDPLATIAVSAAPVVLEGRYRLLMRALWQLRLSRRTRWGVGLGSAALMLLLAVLAVRHFATTSWPLSHGQPGLLVAAGLLLLLAQALKACGWARLFTNRERPSPLALVAGNGGAALIGVVLPGRFDDAMRIAVVRRYPGCPAGLRAIGLSLVMLGLIDSAALAPLAAVAVAFPGAGGRCACRARDRSRSRDRGLRGDRGPATPRGKRTRTALPARPLADPAHDLAVPRDAGVGVRVGLLARPRGGDASSFWARSDWVTRSHSRCYFSAPVPQPQRYRSGRRAQPPRQAPEPPPSPPPVSEHHRRLPPLSPSAPWESSPEQPSCSSPLPGAPDGCSSPLGPQPEGDAPEVVDRVLGGEEDAHPPPGAQRRGRTRARSRAASRA
jgi:hypothetical protein